MLEELLKFIGDPRDKEPVILLKEDERLLFLDKKLQDARDKKTKELERIANEAEEISANLWKEIRVILEDKNLVKKGDDLKISDGVIYKMVDKD